MGQILEGVPEAGFLGGGASPALNPVEEGLAGGEGLVLRLALEALGGLRDF